MSSTVSHGNSAYSWNTTPRSGPGRVTGSPPTLIRPPVGASKPATMNRSVDLPQPLGPSTETNSPSATEKSMRSIAVTSPAARTPEHLRHALRFDEHVHRLSLRRDARRRYARAHDVNRRSRSLSAQSDT